MLHEKLDALPNTDADGTPELGGRAWAHVDAEDAGEALHIIDTRERNDDIDIQRLEPSGMDDDGSFYVVWEYESEPPETLEDIADELDEKIVNDVRVAAGKVRVDNSITVGTSDLKTAKDLGLNLSFAPTSDIVFVHDELGASEYCYAYGSDGSEQ